MEQLVLLLVFCIALAFLSFYSSRWSLLSPHFCFTICFVPGIAFSFFYIDGWNLDLSSMTVLVYLLGIFTFFITCLASQAIFNKFTIKSKYSISKRINKLNISKSKLALIIVIQLITLALTYIFLFRHYGTNLSEAMFNYRINETTNSSSFVELPFIIKILRRFCLSIGFFTCYLFVRELVYGYSVIKKISFYCTLLAILNGITLGARGDSIHIIFAGIIQFLIIYGIKNRGHIFKISIFFKIIGIFLILLFSFSFVGELLGRNMMTFLGLRDYIAVYISAEIKNLDTFIGQGNFGSSLSNSQVFANLSKLLAFICMDPSIEHSLTNPFQFINGFALGNVSTIFYAFVFDGGLIGLVIFTVIMGIVCQFFFYKALKSDPSSQICLSIIFYSYVLYTVSFSFFSDKFYEMIFNPVFVWFSLILFLAKRFFSMKFNCRY